MSGHNITYFNNEWTYWSLFHKVTFDGPNKLILINEGVTTLNIKEDVYSAWKEWVRVLGDYGLHHENAAFLEAISAIGGEPTPTGAIGSTFFLENDWKIKPYSGSYRLTVNGNLFSSDGTNPYVAADVTTGIPNNINISSNTSNIVDLINAGFGSDQVIYLDELHKIHGLREGFPLIVDPTSRTAGVDIQQTITTTGGDNDPVTITRDP